MRRHQWLDTGPNTSSYGIDALTTFQPKNGLNEAQKRLLASFGTDQLWSQFVLLLLNLQ